MIAPIITLDCLSKKKMLLKLKKRRCNKKENNSGNKLSLSKEKEVKIMAKAHQRKKFSIGIKWPL